MTMHDDAARRSGYLRAVRQWEYEMEQRANCGDRIARETLEKLDNEPPSTAELELMRNDPGAFDENFVAKWNHLL